MPRFIDYSNALIYRLCCIDTDIEDIYIGSTTNFKKRKSQHRGDCNSTISKNANINVYQFIRAHGGWGNWSMIEVEKFACNDKRELETRERYWIELLKPSLNKIIPTRTHAERYDKDKKSEYNKQYRELNKDKLSEYNKQYRENNKDRFSEYDKQYYEKNKDKQREKIYCDCGSEVRGYGMPGHKKTKKHLYYQQIHDFILE